MEVSNKTLEQKKADLQRLLQRKLKQTKNYLQKAEAELHKANQWQSLWHEAELLQANLYQIKKGANQFTLFDWEKEVDVTIQLDPLKPVYEIVKERFKKSKKLKTSISYLESYLGKKKNEIALLEKHLEDLNLIDGDEALNQFQIDVLGPSKPAKSKKKQPRVPYNEYVTNSGLKIFVGKTAKDNEFVTFSLAQGNDWWLHVSDYPGSHVVLRVKKGVEPDPESVNDAIQLALYYSKAREREEGEVCVTQKKYVARLSGVKRGTVQVSKHKNIFARFDKERFRNIKKIVSE